MTTDQPVATADGSIVPPLTALPEPSGRMITTTGSRTNTACESEETKKLQEQIKELQTKNKELEEALHIAKNQLEHEKKEHGKTRLVSSALRDIM